MRENKMLITKIIHYFILLYGVLKSNAFKRENEFKLNLEIVSN